jgi:hypothetical protein
MAFMYEAIERAIERAEEAKLKDYKAFIHGLDTA